MIATSLIQLIADCLWFAVLGANIMFYIWNHVELRRIRRENNRIIAYHEQFARHMETMVQHEDGPSIN
jgi:hypothetical protein